jgi:iron complex transport system ATP-binding protein
VSPTLLEVRELSFAYGERRVLDGVSLTVARGEMVGLVGPNGAGKSTLVRLISHVLEPQPGRVWSEGRDVRKLSRGTLARRVAVVPQAPNLPPAYTALDLVLLGRTPHLRLLQREGPRDWAIAVAALEATGAAHLAGRRLGELSGGERQRVVLARALAQEPALLLLDEPTAHLDLGHQVSALALVRDLGRTRGLGVLAVFHDLSLAAQFCDRLVLLVGGRVCASGPPEVVLDPSVLGAAYGVEVQILTHPQTGRPVVVPLLSGVPIPFTAESART